MHAQRSIADLVGVLLGRRIVALTGAGISTESGIPDYRGPTTRHLPRKPIQHREFLERAEVRRRYWARSMVGYRRFDGVEPNRAHEALVRLERGGVLAGVITQNVDGLHGAAGTRRMVELHGTIHSVRCMACGARETRADLQRRLEAANPALASTIATVAPDGDADLDDAIVDAFVPATCLSCGGDLMPEVVFFGGNVPAPVVAAAWSIFDEAECLLVIGSSLTVYSGYRFAKRASERGIPIAIVNLGETRADPIGMVRVDANAGDVLPTLSAALLLEEST